MPPQAHLACDGEASVRRTEPQQVMQGGRSVMGGFSGVMRGSMAGSGI